jgi:hypothetical protein
MGVGAANRMIDWCLVLLFADWIGRREDAVVYRAGLSNEAGSLALRPWDKSNNFTHIHSKRWLDVMLPIRSCTPLAFSIGSRSSECFGRINMRGFLSSPLVVVGKCLKLTRNRSVGHGSGSAEQSLCCF